MPSELPEAVLKIVFDNIAPEISTFFTAFTVLSIIISVVIILHVFERLFIHVLNYTHYNTATYTGI